MRPSEWISVAALAGFLLAGVLAPLDRRRRRRIVALGAVGICGAAGLQFLESSLALRVLRDLAPGLFLLLAYWQSGQFFSGGNARLQAALHAIDHHVFPSAAGLSTSLDRRPLLATYLEGAYFLCYPIVPLAVAILYLADRADAVDMFWTVVLPPTFACYGLTAVFQSLPPRRIEGRDAATGTRTTVRSLNLWVLRLASIRANTLPSGHVACSFAIALVLLTVAPVAGALLLWSAASIAVAAVVLRYHYSLDALLGIALAFLSFSVLG